MQAEPAPSRASSLPQGSVSNRISSSTPIHCGSEPAREAVYQSLSMPTEPTPSRAGSLPQLDRGTAGRDRPAIRPPREQALLPQISHRVLCRTESQVQRQSIVGASLLAIAVHQSLSMQAEQTPSRAGSLPQLDWGKTGESGRLSGRLASKLCSHRSCSNRSERCTTERARSAIRPPREQALLPQVLLKQI
ncbi:hypothetical protein PHLH4_59300 [Pseudomonas sp. St316]|nr:hypothetical protein PHLH4_59300 [Pseudomonas sp. St316]